MDDAAPVTIRPYREEDRSSVRTIACDTADRGSPVESFFADREVFADLITRYYTDLEPASVWIAEEAGKIVGYLTGCIDSRRFIRCMALRIIPAVLARIVARGLWRNREARRFLARNLSLWVRYGTEKTVDYSRYPSHLHINLAPGVRGRNLGGELVARFEQQARERGSGGIHCSVREDSEKARRFFERMGFAAMGRHPVMKKDDAPGGIVHAVIYGKKL